MSDGFPGEGNRGQPITRELSIGEMVSKSFDIYRRNFVKFVTIYIVVEAIVGITTTVVDLSLRSEVSATTAGGTITLGAVVGEVFSALAVSLLIAVVIFPFEFGTAVKMTDDDIQSGRTDLPGSLRFILTRLIPFWITTIIVAVVVGIGLLLVIVPGVILAIMLSLVLPVVVLEKLGVFASLSRGRMLVSHRWGKSLVYYIVLLLIIGIPELIFDFLSRLAGPGSTIVSSILSAFVLPIAAIGLTVHYRSNVARTTPSPPAPAESLSWLTPAATSYCSSCGTKIAGTAVFCPSCGAKQDLQTS